MVAVAAVAIRGGGLAVCRLFLMGAALLSISPRLRGGDGGGDGSSEEEGGLEGVGSLLVEDESFFRRDEGGWDEYKRLGGGDVKLALSSRHSLWGHLVWNAGRATARYIEEKPEMVRGKCVVELGAGAGLPSIVSALEGASLVSVTDYPDDVLLDALRLNVLENGLSSDTCHVLGHKWGEDTESLVRMTPEKRGYDLVLLCDVVFNHMCHRALLGSCVGLVRRGQHHGVVVVSFSHHRPSLADKDLGLLRMAEQEFGFRVELVETRSMEAMQYGEGCRVKADDTYEEGSEPSRTVYIYAMSLPPDAQS